MERFWAWYWRWPPVGRRLWWAFVGATGTVLYQAAVRVESSDPWVKLGQDVLRAWEPVAKAVLGLLTGAG